jgi:hypothetical protein
MAAEDYRAVIVERYPYENPDDVVYMIEALARLRAKNLQMEVSDEIYDFAANVLCVLLDPVKDDEYEQSIAKIRQAFSGIAHSASQAEAFSQAVTQDLLSAPSAAHAIRLGARHLLRMPMRLNDSAM